MVYLHPGNYVHTKETTTLNYAIMNVFTKYEVVSWVWSPFFLQKILPENDLKIQN